LNAENPELKFRTIIRFSGKEKKQNTCLSNTGKRLNAKDCPPHNAPSSKMADDEPVIEKEEEEVKPEAAVVV
jgi:hypothetical protein